MVAVSGAIAVHPYGEPDGAPAIARALTESALQGDRPGLFTQNPTDARTALAMVRDASDVLGILLEGGHSTVAGRLAGRFRNIGRDNIADAILQAMRSAGCDVRESDPFEARVPFARVPRDLSPLVLRMRLFWKEMREIADKALPQAPGLPKDKAAYLKTVGEIYLDDAYHSLSIEGHRVSRALIERVRSGAWNPDSNANDRQQRDSDGEGQRRSRAGRE